MKVSDQKCPKGWYNSCLNRIRWGIKFKFSEVSVLQKTCYWTRLDLWTLVNSCEQLFRTFFHCLPFLTKPNQNTYNLSTLLLQLLQLLYPLYTTSTLLLLSSPLRESNYKRPLGRLLEKLGPNHRYTSILLRWTSFCRHTVKVEWTECLLFWLTCMSWLWPIVTLIVEK